MIVELEIPAPSVKITIAEFIDDIEKNGWPQLYGGLFNTESISSASGEARVDKDKVTEACAFGQGMLNAGLFMFDGDTTDRHLVKLLYEKISHWNDVDQFDIPTIVTLAREEFADDLDKYLTGWNYEDYASGRIKSTWGLARG